MSLNTSTLLTITLGGVALCIGFYMYFFDTSSPITNTSVSLDTHEAEVQENKHEEPSTENIDISTQKDAPVHTYDKVQALNKATIEVVSTPPSKEAPSKEYSSFSDYVPHSIPFKEIISTGVPKGGVPALVNPKFVTTSDADIFLLPETEGIGIVQGKEIRFYPFSILLWHELVNDTIEGKPILVSYDPLSGVSAVFERKIEGEVLTFGVSSRFWKSNVLMYNVTDLPQKESLWSQILGKAVVGGATGKMLVPIHFDVMSYAKWKALYPETKVLSIRTPYGRNYADDPYGTAGYYTSSVVSYGAVFTYPTPFHPKEKIVGLTLNGLYRAYPLSRIPQGVIHDEFAGETIRIERDFSGSVRFFKESEKGEELLPTMRAYWFAWRATHKNTEVYNP